MKHSVFCARLLDAHTFVSAFIAPHGDTTEGKLIIDFGCGHAHIAVNLLPLLHQLRRLPQFVVHAHYPNALDYEKDLNMLLNVRTGRWFDHLSVDISRITVKTQGDISYVQISLNQGATGLRLQEVAHMGPLHEWIQSGAARTQWEECCARWMAENGIRFEGPRVSVLPC